MTMMNERTVTGAGVTALVLGIVSLAMFCVWPVSMATAVLAIVFGARGLKARGSGMATAGLVMGIIAVAFWLTLYAFAWVVWP